MHRPQLTLEQDGRHGDRRRRRLDQGLYARREDVGGRSFSVGAPCIGCTVGCRAGSRPPAPDASRLLLALSAHPSGKGWGPGLLPSPTQPSSLKSDQGQNPQRQSALGPASQLRSEPETPQLQPLHGASRDGPHHLQVPHFPAGQAQPGEGPSSSWAPGAQVIHPRGPRYRAHARCPGVLVQTRCGQSPPSLPGERPSRPPRSRLNVPELLPGRGIRQRCP